MACNTTSNTQTLQLISPDKLPQTCAQQSTLNQIFSDAFVILGAIAILMIVIAGLRYIFARGDAEKVKQAKNVILYSVIGLVISASAYSIVNFVLKRTG